MEPLNHIELPAGFGQTRGSEHEVWMSPGGTRVIKATHAGEFGRKFGPDRFATEAEYLERIRMMNAEFQIDWRVEGVNGVGDNRRIVTSQPLFAGDPPSHASIRRFLEKFGFQFFSTRLATPGIANATACWSVTPSPRTRCNPSNVSSLLIS